MLNWLRKLFTRRRYTFVVHVGAHVFTFPNVCPHTFCRNHLKLSKKQLEAIFDPREGHTAFAGRQISDQEIQAMIGHVSAARPLEGGQRICVSCGVHIDPPDRYCHECFAGVEGPLDAGGPIR